MARYIDADQLRRRVKEKTNPYGKPTLEYASGVKVLDMIDREPTADVAEVVHAAWKWGKQCGREGIYCTNCQAGWVNSENAEWIAKSHDYCPKCGAKMDGER